MRVNRGEMVVPVIFAAYCLAYLLQVYDLPTQSTKYPYIIMALATALLVVVLLRFGLGGGRRLHEPGGGAARAGTDNPAAASLQRPSWVSPLAYRPISVLLATFVSPYLMVVLGFTITTWLFLAALFWVFGTRRPATVVFFSLVTALVLFVTMTFYLKLTLPAFALADLPFGL
jgi:hypothetical protein